ncbi:hypothetical protein [Bacillus massiliigorillae]|uniref:hypothetical protein n=1 Tax=Bacillus massiliigorillae TaxID=1243664 RepID=UPI0003A7E373|nr:hypothetical protein [Bacillus massiliigorillae]
MIEKMILCKHPKEQNAPSNLLCSAVLIFKEGHPLVYAYCDILIENEDIHIQSHGWGIATESMIKKIQMYVRNKIDAIETGKIPTFAEACKRRDTLLRKQGRYFEEEIKHVEITEEEQEILHTSHVELEAMKAQVRKEMQELIKKVNGE